MGTIVIGRELSVRVPASTANLGSGFDTLGLALALYDEVRLRVVDRGVRVEVSGEGAEAVPRDASHLLLRALRAATDALGVELPGVELRCVNRIPHARGLGSSAATIVSGIAAGYALAGRKPDESALDLAARFEGHADNVAASMVGGVVVAWSSAGASPTFRALRLEPHRALAPVLLVPEVESATHTTRGLLPERVPHEDAAFAASRAALAVAALTSRPDLLLDATGDRLHQEYRRPAWPRSLALVEELRAAGVPAAISGAGPTVVAFPVGAPSWAGFDTSGFEVCPLAVDTRGVTVREEPADP
ncbi:homoserine kinase [Actinoalloteichus sp. AHMU CJ021]|uniref:homoserine kinase n=1 Tax=Actinoalloteichus sp. AHMU CJ021 TaxID=2072503 RepID=UPI00307C34B7